MSGRRIDLSATQLAASVLAAVTAAIAASYLGVAGTIIGAGVVSFASTAGTAVYRHYLGRTEDKLRSAAAQLPHASVRAGSHRPAVPGSPVQAPVPERAGAPVGYHLARPTLDSGPAAGAILGGQAPTKTAAEGPPSRSEDLQPVEPTVNGERAGRHAAARPGRVRWLAWAGAGIGVFLLTMAGITVFELATGRPLDATVWQQHGSGTTIGDVVTGNGGTARPTTRPSSGPSQRATAPATPSTAPSPSAPPAGTPAPTSSPPGSSPSPGTSGSAGAAVTPAPTR